MPITSGLLTVGVMGGSKLRLPDRTSGIPPAQEIAAQRRRIDTAQVELPQPPPAAHKTQFAL